MRIVFMGTPQSAIPSLRRCLDDGHELVAVWTQPDKPAGRGNKLHQSPIKEFALQHRIAVHQPARIKTPEAKGLFTSAHADAAIVVGYGKILPADFLSMPSYGCINLHFSLLPKYRGAAPVNWAVVNGEKETGVSTMQIVEALDAGPILLQRSTKINERENAPELLARLAEIGADLLSETLKRLDSIEPQLQQDEDATFAPILRRQDGLIDWSMDAFAIERRVRGFQPWPNVYTFHASRRLIIWQAAPEKTQPSSNPQAGVAASRLGQIVGAQGDKLVIACGGGTALQLIELQPDGKRRMKAGDFLNGTHLKVGEMLSQS